LAWSAWLCWNGFTRFICFKEYCLDVELVASVRDFSDDKRFNGWLGLLGSVGLVLHDLSVSKNIALMWSPDNPLPYTGLFSFLILIGLLLEFRLILTVDLKEKKRVAVKSKTAISNGVHTAVKN